MKTVNRQQFKRLVESLDAHAILKSRDKSDKAMDKRSALLHALLSRLRERLGVPDGELTTKGFKTYEVALREEIYELASERATKPFEYQPIVNGFLLRSL